MSEHSSKLKKYPFSAQFFNQSELDYEALLADQKLNDHAFGVTALQNMHWHLSHFSDQLKMSSEKNKSGPQISYTAMTLFHICLKHYEQSQKAFDAKLLLLACLRISAVTYDVEIRQDYYIDVYYKQVDREDRAREMMQSPTSNETAISGSTAQLAGQSNYIQLDKIIKKLTTNFIQLQTMVFEIIGYNFNFKTPYEILQNFEYHHWRELKGKLAATKSENEVNELQKPKNEEAEKEIMTCRQDIHMRFMQTVKQVVSDSAILPLALHFEPEEIAAACLSLGSLVFKESLPRFTSQSCRPRVKEINQSLTMGSNAPQQTGQQILEKYFKDTKWLETDLNQNYYKIRNEQDLAGLQPDWFKHLIPKDQGHMISLHQVDFVTTLILKVFHQQRDPPFQ